MKHSLNYRAWHIHMLLYADSVLTTMLMYCRGESVPPVKCGKAGMKCSPHPGSYYFFSFLFSMVNVPLIALPFIHGKVLPVMQL